MKEYFLQLYRYNDWSNRRVLNALQRQQVNEEKILSLLGHIAAAQYLWLYRIKSLPAPDVKLWGTYSLSKLTSMSNDIGEQWTSFIQETDNFNRELAYTNYTGDPYSNNVEMIMIHVVNHSSYHRGQIAQLMRQEGFEPVNTDFITYDRVLRGQLKE